MDAGVEGLSRGLKSLLKKRWGLRNFPEAPRRPEISSPIPRKAHLAIFDKHVAHLGLDTR